MFNKVKKYAEELCNAVANSAYLVQAMKSRSLILRCLASFLILIFSQKTGAGLLYHNLFHDSSRNEAPVSAEKNTSLTCACIDDYLMPFESAEQPQLSIPFTVVIPTPGIFEDRLPFYTPVYSLFRGPPSVVNG